MDENKVVEQEKTINPLDYVTIPVKEYKKLIGQTAKKSIKKKYKAQIKELSERVDQYRRWWNQEEIKSSELRKNLDDAKALIAEKLGVDPDEFLAKKGETDKETEKLADLQFEKEVDVDA